MNTRKVYRVHAWRPFRFAEGVTYNHPKYGLLDAEGFVGYTIEILRMGMVVKYQTVCHVHIPRKEYWEIAFSEWPWKILEKAVA